jgi:mannitol/fructose-specific phosphotransferase system IIA component (Ntr-type)
MPISIKRRKTYAQPMRAPDASLLFCGAVIYTALALLNYSNAETLVSEELHVMQGDAHSPKGIMQRTINHLIQLQELLVARAQQEAMAPNERLEQLEAAIGEMWKQLPNAIAEKFRRIEQKSLLGIVPIANGVCSACGMVLPVSLVHDVHAAAQLYTCPNCARILYYPEAGIRRVSKTRRRSDVPKVGIERYSASELMIPELAARDRDEALNELCAKLEAEGFVENAQRLVNEALKREAIATTAIGNGLAFPHVRGVEGGGLTLALGISSKGLRYAGSRGLVHVVFFMVIPTAASAFYLKLLSGLVQVFQDKEARDKLMGHDTPDKLWKAVIKATKTVIR